MRPWVMERGQVQEAMAYRVKYRVGKPRSIVVDMLGVHMMNRGGHGIYPNGSDVVHLGKKKSFKVVSTSPRPTTTVSR